MRDVNIHTHTMHWFFFIRKDSFVNKVKWSMLILLVECWTAGYWHHFYMQPSRITISMVWKKWWIVKGNLQHKHNKKKTLFTSRVCQLAKSCLPIRGTFHIPFCYDFFFIFYYLSLIWGFNFFIIYFWILTMFLFVTKFLILFQNFHSNWFPFIQIHWKTTNIIIVDFSFIYLY